MEKWKFGVNNNELIELVLKGKKTATCWLFENDSLDIEESILLDDYDVKVCKIKTKRFEIIKFKDVLWELAKLEGEFSSLEEWKKFHYEFFEKEKKDFSEEDLIIFEIFEVIEKY